MKLTRFYRHDKFCPGLFVEDRVVLDATGFGEDWNEEFFGSGGLARLDSWLANNRTKAQTFSIDEIRLAPAIARPSKLICIGLNYADHAKETGATPPAEPVVFMKSSSAWCGQSRHTQRFGENRLGSGARRRNCQESTVCGRG